MSQSFSFKVYRIDKHGRTYKRHNKKEASEASQSFSFKVYRIDYMALEMYYDFNQVNRLNPFHSRYIE